MGGVACWVFDQRIPAGLPKKAPSAGAGVVMNPGGNRLLTDFSERGSVDGLDTDGVGDVRRPPFFISPAGPDPAEGDSIPR